MSNVEISLESVNNGKNTVPIIKVDDRVFLYDNKGFHDYPVKELEKRGTWRQLGKSALKVSEATKMAYNLYLDKYKTFDHIKSNPVQFAYDLTKMLIKLTDEGVWNELKNQNWEGVFLDMKKILSSSNSSFTSMSSSLSFS